MRSFVLLANTIHCHCEYTVMKMSGYIIVGAGKGEVMERTPEHGNSSC